MNRSKLKIKYLFDLYKLSPVYPTEDDILFEYITGLEETGKIKEVFPNKILRKFCNKLPEQYENEREIMQVFVDSGYFEIVNQYKKTNTEIIEYKLLKHPWE